jgi:hypothetical protein
MHQDPAAVHSAYVGPTHGAGKDRIALPVVAVTVKSPDGQRAYCTYALLDNGSTSTFISKTMMRRLGIEGERRQVALTTLEKTSSPTWTSTCSIHVSDVQGTNFIKIPTAYARDSLPIKEENIATVEDLDAWPHLRGINLPTATRAEVELLIGQDVPDCLVPQSVIAGRKGEPYAIRTNLGWTLNGPVGTKTTTELTNVTSAHVILEEQVERCWRIDSPDLYSTKLEMSADDRDVVRMWNESVKKDGAHYELPIPFKGTTEINDLIGNGHEEEATDSRTIKECFSVDDRLCTTSDVETAKSLATELKDTLMKAGFTLTKWTANDLNSISSILTEDCAPSIRDLDLEAQTIERALGVIWDTKRDAPTFNISLPTKPPTKRGILSVLSSVYDPLGLIGPFILRARQVVQELFRREVGWDEAIPEDLHEEWRSWLQQVSDLENLSAQVDEHVREQHEIKGHAGREFTLSSVMSKYWVIGASKIIRDVIDRCVTCSKIRQTTVQQRMADLPKDRVTPGTIPFASVGCDYFGSFHVKRGRGRVKRYGCIFTCLSTRSVHLEVAPSLDTSQRLCELSCPLHREARQA